MDRVLDASEQVLLVAESVEEVNREKGERRVLTHRVRVENLGPSHAVLTHIGFSGEETDEVVRFTKIPAGESAVVLDNEMYRAILAEIVSKFNAEQSDAFYKRAVDVETKTLVVTVATPHGEQILQWYFSGNPESHDPMRLSDVPSPLIGMSALEDL